MRLFSARDAALGAAILIGSLGATSAAAPPDSYAVGTAIRVELTRGATSETAHPGDTFYFETTEDIKLGALDVPPGTPGTGRLAVADPASSKVPGRLWLQADSLTVGTQTVWVNIDPTVQPHGHYASNHDLVLDPGMKFRVVTIAPRKDAAPLVSPPPSDAPTTVAPGGSVPSPSSTS